MRRPPCERDHPGPARWSQPSRGAGSGQPSPGSRCVKIIVPSTPPETPLDRFLSMLAPSRRPALLAVFVACSMLPNTIHAADSTTVAPPITKDSLATPGLRPAETPSAGTAEPGRTGGVRLSWSGAVLGVAINAGLENVSAAEHPGGVNSIAYENRRYRHSADALGVLARDLGGTFTAFERRLGLVAGAIDVRRTGDSTSFHVRYPSDPDFPEAPAGSAIERTSRSVDLLMQPVI